MNCVHGHIRKSISENFALANLCGTVFSADVADLIENYNKMKNNDIGGIVVAKGSTGTLL